MHTDVYLLRDAQALLFMHIHKLIKTRFPTYKYSIFVICQRNIDFH